MAKLLTFVKSLENIDEAAKPFYVEAEGGFKLDIDGEIDGVRVADLGGLLSNHDRLKQSFQKASEKAEKLQADLEAERQKTRKKAEDSGDLQTVLEALKAENESLSTEMQTIRGQLASGEIDDKVRGLVGGLTKDADRAKALMKLAKPYAEHDGQGVKWVVGGSEQDASFVATMLKTEYPFLIDGTEARGGNGNGSDSSGKAELTMSRSEFQKLPPAKQSELGMKNIQLTD